MKYWFGILAALAIVEIVQAKEREMPLYELRTYHAAPGKLDALLTRFREHTTKLFAEHGMTNVGYWVPADNTNQLLIYLLAYPSRKDREESWKAFQADHEWQTAKAASEVNGPLTTNIDSVYLNATDFSPAIKPEKSSKERFFELRVYHAAPGKLEALETRFRDHTVQLFKKHGMTNFGYWVPENNAEQLLIYVLAFPNREARETAFKEFAADPDWVAAKKASEVNGPLTTKIDSVYLKPTDFSPTR